MMVGGIANENCYMKIVSIKRLSLSKSQIFQPVQVQVLLSSQVLHILNGKRTSRIRSLQNNQQNNYSEKERYQIQNLNNVLKGLQVFCCVILDFYDSIFCDRGKYISTKNNGYKILSVPM